MAEGAPGCWLWDGQVDREGYGRFKVSGRRRAAHRVAYELMIGPIGSGLEIDHVCHTRDETCDGGSACLHRRCVNPEHLEAVPGVVNNARSGSLTAINARKTHCKWGHEFTPENTYWCTRRYGKYQPSRRCRECRRLTEERRSLRNRTK
jgi:hypothetical protein